MIRFAWCWDPQAHVADAIGMLRRSRIYESLDVESILLSSKRQCSTFCTVGTVRASQGPSFAPALGFVRVGRMKVRSSQPYAVRNHPSTSKRLSSTTSGSLGLIGITHKLSLSGRTTMLVERPVDSTSLVCEWLEAPSPSSWECVYYSFVQAKNGNIGSCGNLSP